MTSIIPSNGVNRAAAAFHSSYAQCGSSMLEFTSTDFGYELSVANYAGRAANLVACYPDANENFNLAAWEPPNVYQYQPAISGELGGLFGAGAARPNHLMQQRFAHNGKGANGSAVASKSKPRRRIASIAQRRAANIRERRRMFNLNEAFDVLRKKVPTFAYEKRLSRIETLRLAITYIAFMTDVLQGKCARNDSLFANDGGGHRHQSIHAQQWAGHASVGHGQHGSP